jgi:hypothetical protein
MSAPSLPQVNDLPRVGPTTIEVWWDPPLSDGGNPVLDYTIACVSPALSFTIPAPQNYYLVTGLTTGVSYAFTITANNTNGSSDPAAFRTVICGNFPAAPENVSTVYQAISSGIATVTWDTPLSDGGAALKYYAVEATPLYSNYVSSVSFGTPVTQLQRYCTGLIANQNYKFSVNSINDPGYSLLPSTNQYWLFSPSNLPDLFLWFDGADPTSYVTDPNYGNAITVWRSKTTNGFSTIGETVTRSPFLSNAEFGLFPALYFNPVNPYTERTTMLSPDIPALTCNSGFVACTVVRQVDQGTPRGIWSTYTPEFPGGINMFWNNVDQFEFYNNSNAIQLSPSSILTNTLITCAYETTEIGGPLNFGITFNGNDLITNTTASQPIVSGFVLGNFDPIHGGGFIYPDNGFIAEHIVVQNDPSQATRQKVEGYLAWKYDLASQLPPTHPYYTSPPLS